MISPRLTESMERKIRGFAILEDAGLYASTNKAEGEWKITVSGCFADVDDKGNPVTRHRQADVCKVKNPGASYVHRNTHTGKLETLSRPEREAERDRVWEIFQSRHREAERIWKFERSKYPAIFEEG